MLRVVDWVMLFYQYRGKNSRGKTSIRFIPANFHNPIIP